MSEYCLCVNIIIPLPTVLYQGDFSNHPEARPVVLGPSPSALEEIINANKSRHLGNSPRMIIEHLPRCVLFPGAGSG